MSGDYAVYLGSGCIDKYFSVPAWPAEGDKALARHTFDRCGGMIANAAATMAAYGLKTYCLDVKSDGAEADFLIDDLRASCIDTSRIIRRPGISDAYCAVVQSGGGERTIFVVEGSGDHTITADEKLLDFISGAACVYGSLELRGSLINYREAFSRLRARGGRLALDVELLQYHEGWREIAGFADIVYFNDFSFERFSRGLPENEFFESLFAMGVSTVVLTLGAEGCRVITREQDFAVSCYDVEVVDTTGAGDTFNSSFLAARQFGWNVRRAAEFATAAANIAVSVEGPRGGVRPRAEVEAFMASRTLAG